MPIYGSPTFCAASAIGPTGNPTTPNMYSTPCSLRLLASKSAPLISAIISLLSFELVSDPACRKSEPAHITHLWRPGSSRGGTSFRHTRAVSLRSRGCDCAIPPERYLRRYSWRVTPCRAGGRQRVVLRPGADPMNIHEYQAKELLARWDVPVPPGAVAYTAAEAVEAAKRLGGSVWAIKAQIHAGGRGKAGGVKIARSEDEVAAAARALIGTALVTPQTGPEGRVVKRVFVEMGIDIERELYLALSIDRGTGRVTLIGAGEAGMDIEELVARS